MIKKALLTIIFCIFIFAALDQKNTVPRKNTHVSRAFASLSFDHLLYGLPFYEENGRKSLHRLPISSLKNFTPATIQSSLIPSGVRIRFRSNGRTFKVMTEGTGTYSLWVNDKFFAQGNGNSVFQIKKARRMYNYTLYLPTVGDDFEFKGIKFFDYPEFAAPKAFPKRLPIVYLGTSITQGPISLPGKTYPAVASRALNFTDYYNLGLSKVYRRKDTVLADVISQVQASVYVLDHWADLSAEDYAASLIPMIKRLREKREKTPIILTTPVSSSVPQLNENRMNKRKLLLAEFEKIKKMDLGPIMIHDWSQLLDNSDFTDGFQPSVSGHEKMGKSIAEKIEKIIL